ncbi:unnamed protein product [Closterium sp. NIES-64]|nr:unnamed protein product [Closterium sp. NIES-64]
MGSDAGLDATQRACARNNAAGARKLAPRGAGAGADADFERQLQQQRGRWSMDRAESEHARSLREGLKMQLRQGGRGGAVAGAAVGTGRGRGCVGEKGIGRGRRTRNEEGPGGMGRGSDGTIGRERERGRGRGGESGGTRSGMAAGRGAELRGGAGESATIVGGATGGKQGDGATGASSNLLGPISQCAVTSVVSENSADSADGMSTESRSAEAGGDGNGANSVNGGDGANGASSYPSSLASWPNESPSAVTSPTTSAASETRSAASWTCAGAFPAVRHPVRPTSLALVSKRGRGSVSERIDTGRGAERSAGRSVGSSGGSRRISFPPSCSMGDRSRSESSRGTASGGRGGGGGGGGGGVGHRSLLVARTAALASARPTAAAGGDATGRRNRRARLAITTHTSFPLKTTKATCSSGISASDAERTNGCTTAGGGKECSGGDFGGSLTRDSSGSGRDGGAGSGSRGKGGAGGRDADKARPPWGARAPGAVLKANVVLTGAERRGGVLSGADVRVEGVVSAGTGGNNCEGHVERVADTGAGADEGGEVRGVGEASVAGGIGEEATQGTVDAVGKKGEDDGVWTGGYQGEEGREIEEEECEEEVVEGEAVPPEREGSEESDALCGDKAGMRVGELEEQRGESQAPAEKEDEEQEREEEGVEKANDCGGKGTARGETLDCEQELLVGRNSVGGSGVLEEVALEAEQSLAAGGALAADHADAEAEPFVVVKGEEDKEAGKEQGEDNDRNLDAATAALAKVRPLALRLRAMASAAAASSRVKAKAVAAEAAAAAAAEAEMLAEEADTEGDGASEEEDGGEGVVRGVLAEGVGAMHGDSSMGAGDHRRGVEQVEQLGGMNAQTQLTPLAAMAPHNRHASPHQRVPSSLGLVLTLTLLLLASPLAPAETDMSAATYNVPYSECQRNPALRKSKVGAGVDSVLALCLKSTTSLETNFENANKLFIGNMSNVASFGAFCVEIKETLLVSDDGLSIYPAPLPSFFIRQGWTLPLWGPAPDPSLVNETVQMTLTNNGVTDLSVTGLDFTQFGLPADFSVGPGLSANLTFNRTQVNLDFETLPLLQTYLSGTNPPDLQADEVISVVIVKLYPDDPDGLLGRAAYVFLKPTNDQINPYEFYLFEANYYLPPPTSSGRRRLLAAIPKTTSPPSGSQKGCCAKAKIPPTCKPGAPTWPSCRSPPCKTPC